MNAVKIVAAIALIGLSACNTSGSGGAGASGSTQSASGGRFLASNSMVVFGDPAVPGRFEVQQRAGRGGSDYWCAAGEYAIRSLGVSPGSRIYLETPYGQGHLSSNAKTAGFTVAPSADLRQRASMQSNGLTMRIDRVGENWSAEHGRTNCDSQFTRGF